MTDVLIYKTQISLAVSKAGRGLTPDQKQDASQNCYLKLLEIQAILLSIIREMGQDSANKYAYSVSYNEVIDMYKLKIEKHKLQSISEPKIFEEADRKVSNTDNVFNTRIDGVDDAVYGLPELDRYVIQNLFYGNKTETQIAETINTSQQYVSKIKKRALKKLKETLENACP